MDRFNDFPDEIKSLILQHACESAATTPRLAIVTVQAGATLPNLTPAASLSLGRQHAVSNGAYLQETLPLRGLLGASYTTREAARRAITQLHVNPPWAQTLLGLTDFVLTRTSDILFLRGTNWPFQYTTALGLVIGEEFPNIMLDAATFTDGSWGSVLLPNREPVALCLQHLQTTSRLTFNNNFNAGHQDLTPPHPQLPQNLYFFLGRYSCPNPLHSNGCAHYEDLEIIHSSRLDEWNPFSPELGRQLGNIYLVLASWRGLNIRVPTVFYARVRRAPARSFRTSLLRLLGT